MKLKTNSGPQTPPPVCPAVAAHDDDDLSREELPKALESFHLAPEPARLVSCLYTCHPGQARMTTGCWTGWTVGCALILISAVYRRT